MIKLMPGRDVFLLAGLREDFPSFAFMAFSISAYTLDDVARLRELDALDLTMIEQPLRYDDFLHHARLQEQIETAVCLDESIKTVGSHEVSMKLHRDVVGRFNVEVLPQNPPPAPVHEEEVDAGPDPHQGHADEAIDEEGAG